MSVVAYFAGGFMHACDRRTENDPTTERLIAHCDELLSQLDGLLGALSDDEFRRDFGPQAGSIGGQVRHVLDHFASLLAGDDVVDYDARERDVNVERCRVGSARRIAQVRQQLKRVTFTRGTLGVRQETQLDGVDAESERLPAESGVGAGRGLLRSSAERELAFVASHSVHHMAMIGVMARLCGRQTPSDFGVALSTLRHRREGNTPHALRETSDLRATSGVRDERLTTARR